MMRWLMLLSLPVALAHEASHYAVARLAGADDAGLSVEVTGGHASAVWRPLNSTAWRVLAFLAPTILGVVLMLVWAIAGIRIDGWRLIMAVGLAAYTIPSPADIRGALGRQPAQQ